jgi:hypothetical protein
MRNPIRAAYEECERLSVEERMRLAELYSDTLVELSATVRLAGRSDLQPLLADLADAMNVASHGIATDDLGIDVLLEAGCLIITVQGIVERKPRFRIIRG